MTFRALLAAALLSIWLTPASADGEVDRLITPADKARLKDYGRIRQEAIAEARKGAAAAELEPFEAMLAKPLQSFSGLDMTGRWQCRTTKVGGDLLPFVAYDWFRCRVTDDGSGWKLEKISGSQRTTGRFYDDGDKRLIYLGSQYVDGETAKPYGSGPETDQVGYAFRTGEKEWRIEFPAPYYESKLDILEFRR